MSPLPFLYGLFFIECSVYWVGHKQNPSWCLQVRIICLKPVSFSTRAHCMASVPAGLNNFSLSLPRPHSRSVNVLMVKCTKALVSICCQASWLAVGTGPTGAGGSTFFRCG